MPGGLGAGALASIPGEAGGVHLEDLVNVSCSLASCIAPICGNVRAASGIFFLAVPLTRSFPYCLSVAASE